MSSIIKIGIDAMGGDFAPQAVVEGVVKAQAQLSDQVQIVLFGDEQAIRDEFQKQDKDSSGFEIVHCTEVIGMSEHPTRALTKKPDSSIAKGFKYLATKKINSFASAGNSGAMMVGGYYSVKAIPGIIRPCITATIPLFNGSKAILLDVGVNVDTKADVLEQFGILGSLYSKYVYHVEKPKVALLNIGEEEGKGNQVTQAAYGLLKDNPNIDFIGNIEGRDILFADVDVIVTDGFTGNVVLKQLEGMYTLTKKLKFEHSYIEEFNYEKYGGTPILGMNENVLIGHGISNGTAIMNMVLHSYEVTHAGLEQKIKEAF
jgi:glycerol-3-phosphate acyltransferase PlsX